MKLMSFDEILGKVRLIMMMDFQTVSELFLNKGNIFSL